MDLKTWIVSVKDFIVRKAPDILTGVNVVGVIATGITTHKATKKATAKLESERAKRKEEDPEFKDFSVKEKLLLTWKYYIWPIATGALTIGSGIASNRISSARLAESTAVVALLSDKVEKLEKHIEDKYGKEELEKAKKDIHNGDLDKAHPELDGDGKMLCYEPVSKQYFKASQQQLLMAEITANKIFQNDSVIGFNKFLECLGAKPCTAVNDYCWVMSDVDGEADFNWSFYRGTPWIDIQPVITEMNGKRVLRIEYGMWPMENPEWTNDSNAVIRSASRVEPASDSTIDGIKY